VYRPCVLVLIESKEIFKSAKFILRIEEEKMKSCGTIECIYMQGKETKGLVKLTTSSI